jgi:hypothetical protein
MKLKSRIQYFIRDEVTEPMLFGFLFAVGIIALMVAMAMCSG